MATSFIRNASIVLEDKIVENSSLLINDGKIEKIVQGAHFDFSSDFESIDLSEDYLTPGLIETHMHGCLDFDFLECSQGEFLKIQEFLTSRGITSHLASLSSEEPELMTERIQFLAEMCENKKSPANLIGIHVEGPFIHPKKRGSHLLERVRNPNLDELKKFIDAGRGFIKKVTLAPEVRGAKQLINFLHKNGILVSAGHTYASLNEANEAFSNGVNHLTHFYNSMRESHYRNPSIVDAALLNEDVSIELILDGNHVHREVARLTVKIKGYEKVILVSDANQAAGMPNGVYIRPGNRKITVKDGRALLESGTLAGSVILLDDAVRNVESFLKLNVWHAIKMASYNPARSIGYHNKKGRIAPGYDADLVHFDRELNVIKTMVRGKWIKK